MFYSCSRLQSILLRRAALCSWNRMSLEGSACCGKLKAKGFVATANIYRSAIMQPFSSLDTKIITVQRSETEIKKKKKISTAVIILENENWYKIPLQLYPSNSGSLCAENKDISLYKQLKNYGYKKQILCL